MMQKQYLTRYQDPLITTEELSNMVQMGNSMLVLATSQILMVLKTFNHSKEKFLD